MTISSNERMSILRERCITRKRTRIWPDMLLSTAKSMKASEGLSWTIRMGMRTRDRLAALQFDIDEYELLAGRPVKTAGEDEQERQAAQKYLEQYGWLPGQTGHCELDFSRLFAEGIDGLRASIAVLKAKSLGKTAETYESFILALDGFSQMIENIAEGIEEKMKSHMPGRRGELQEIALSCRRVAHEKPETFLDAMHLMWFGIYATSSADESYLIGPGHIDRTLWPFYKADVDSGRITPQRALMLIESLYIRLNDEIGDGLAIPVMVGGRDAAGNDVTNDLSYLALEAIRRTGMVYPTVGVCWHEGTPTTLVDLTIDLISHSYATPAFFGDETIQHGLRSLGVPPEESHYYVNSTCVEITPCGSSNVWVASPYYNTCGELLKEITGQVNSPSKTFDEFLASYKKRLMAVVAQCVAGENEGRRARQERGLKPLQSVFTRDCIVRGRDIDDGGAKYNWVECSFVGLANLADSLYVIQKEVFEDKRLTLAELKGALDSDFDGCEDMRQRLLNGYPKYGQGEQAVDRFVGEMVEFVARECKQFKMHPDDSHYVPGAFVWIMHELLGRETGATPDGRKAGFPFADGCGPAQGREKFGPTAAILSTTSWSHSPMIGGLAYNMKFNKSLFDTDESKVQLRELVLTFLRRGGFETQINVTDAETLKRAKAEPEKYSDLVVRIGGYCDYFTKLSPQMQAEVMLRTEYKSV